MVKIFSYVYQSQIGVDYQRILDVIKLIEALVEQKIPDRQADFIWSENGKGLCGIILPGRGNLKRIWFQGVSDDASWMPSQDSIGYVRGLLNELFESEGNELGAPFIPVN